MDLPPILSIRQPWAWLIVNSWKNIENRTWPTKFRGRFLVHASQGMTRREYDACAIYALRRDIIIPPFAALKRGGIFGEAHLLECLDWHPSHWFEGPFGFQLARQKPLKFFPCKGALGFFKAPFDRYEFLAMQDGPHSLRP